MIDMREKFNEITYVIMTSSDHEQRTIITAVSEQRVMRPTGLPTHGSHCCLVWGQGTSHS